MAGDSHASRMDIATWVVSMEGVRQMCTADLQLSQRSSVQRLAAEEHTNHCAGGVRISV
jgi:hypothetical protein